VDKKGAIRARMVLALSVVKKSRDIDSALAVFRAHSGLLRTSDALASGVHPHALYELLDLEKIVRLERGLYRLATAREFSDPDLGVVAVKAPEAVVCLMSALNFHGITTHVPSVVSLAVPRGRYSRLRMRTPPVQIYRFDPRTFELGIESHEIDGNPLKVYGVARTLVDCFRYRNKIGIDIAIEALKFARIRKRTSNREILQFAKPLRQERVMAPYLLATA
jgi:predicted transcriptional regulator of viral defense system